VDRKVEFPYATKDITAWLFCLVFKKLLVNILDLEKPSDADETVEKLANEFTSKVLEGEFLLAEVQSFLLENRHLVSGAVKNVDKWMTRVREERMKVKRSDSWVVHG
jgi:hypothetical protein